MRHIKLFENWAAPEKIKQDAVITAKRLLPTFDDRWISDVIDQSSEKGTKIKIELISGDFIHAFKSGKWVGSWDFYLNKKKKTEREITDYLETKLMKPLDMFYTYLKGYNLYTEYIDDGNERKAANANNKLIHDKFNKLSDSDKEIALRNMDDTLKRIFK